MKPIFIDPGQLLYHLVSCCIYGSRSIDYLQRLQKNINFGQAGYRGLGFKIVLTCECGDRSIHLGALINNRTYEINLRLVLAMQLLGAGFNGIKLFCSLMDLGNGLSRSAYDTITNNIYTASKAVFESVIKRAIEQEKRKMLRTKCLFLI